MPSWILKAAVQRTIGVLPAPHFWNELFQKYITRSLDFTEDKFRERLDVCCKHLEYYRTYSDGLATPKRIVEIGTGWHPVVPIGFWLCGVDHVATYDITRHVTPDRLKITLRRFVEAWHDGTLSHQLPWVQKDRVEKLLMLEHRTSASIPVDVLSELGVQYTIGDVATADVPADSVCLIVSYAVLEYIPEKPLRRLLAKCRTILNPTGIMSHWIDLSDEYAYFDKSISRFNFLRYSDATWKLISSPFIPLTRMRLPDFQLLMKQAGFSALKENVTRGSDKDLQSVPIAKRFQNCSAHELMALDVWVISRASLSESALVN